MDREATTAHHFTVDLEEYFQVSAFEETVARDAWTTWPSRVRAQTARLLGLLAETDVHATFFVLGWVADRQRDLIVEIAAAGHEIASHGWEHQRVTALTRDGFRRSVRTSKALLEDLTGHRVWGYRAPSFSIVPGREWALDVLVEEGYRYDSSLFPVRRDGYGYPGGSPDPWTCRRAAGTLLEFPPAICALGPLRVPAGGGGWFRVLPFALITRAFRAATARGETATFYIHPWELDPDQPRVPASRASRWKHYVNLTGTADRLRRLLRTVRFGPIRDSLPWWW
jgi:polysaccharide deacetylase family protein (PEP-CTERM system associated)